MGIIQKEILSTYTSVYKQGEGKCEPEPPSQICLGFRSTTLKLGRAEENPHGFAHHLHPEYGLQRADFTFFNQSVLLNILSKN